MIDEARKRKGWEALAAAWWQEANVSRATLKRFREKKPIQRVAFIAICRAVGIEDWKKVADNTDTDEISNLQKSESICNLTEIQNLENTDQRADQAKRFLVNTVLSNLSNLDARLEFVTRALAEDDFEQQLRSVRQKVAPALDHTSKTGYNQLILQQAAASLRGALNSRPLKTDIEESLLRDLLGNSFEIEKASSFFDRLIDMQDTAESLLDAVTSTASKDLSDPEVLSHHQRRIALEINRFENRTVIAHLSGLLLLNELNIEPSLVADRLAALTHLNPQQLISNSEIETLLSEQVAVATILLEERAALVEEGQNLLQKALKVYEELNQLLEIKPTDTWNEVVGKSISLRQLGRTTEAIAAFSKYRDLFATHDPTAALYSRTAQQFTLELETLGVEGGVYIYELADAGGATRAGLKVGDILISYGDRTVRNMEDLVTALRNSSAGELVRVTYLRVQQNGSFARETTKVVGSPLGAGLMPI